ncbi:MAG: flagellar basal body rod protein FlgC [Pirellulales bacterium]|nr:flagellar basal body rod protein FlgC [Pirellulales bacterium]
MLNALDISTSALVAQRIRLNAISSNLANIGTTRNEHGELKPYSPRYAVFEADDSINTPGGGVGVQVTGIEIIDRPPLMKYEPDHPDSDARGYVAYPNIDMTTEFVDALEATRAYEANIGVIEVTKDLARQTLRIIA